MDKQLIDMIYVLTLKRRFSLGIFEDNIIIFAPYRVYLDSYNIYTGRSSFVDADKAMNRVRYGL